MKPYILDLREERCPMALLQAKRCAKNIQGEKIVIHIVDESSKTDIARYFEKNNFTVQIEDNLDFTVLTVIKKRNTADA